jgi:methionine sulfoxide reductase heme-binding subunit
VHLTSNPVDWYAARAAGIAAYLILSTVVTLGIGMAGRAPTRVWPRFAVESIHRFGGLLVGAFVAIHVVTIAIDSFLPFSLMQLAVPMLSSYRPLWVGLGIAGAELLLALAITNHYRDRIPRRWWRTAHYANFAVWTAATLHGLGSGTDRSAAWMITIYAAAVGSVAAAAAWRFGRGRGWTRERGVGAGLAGAGLVVLLALGPLAAHPRPWNAARFSDTLRGRILESQGSRSAIVSMAGEGDGIQRVLVRADLLLETQSAERTSLQLEYLPSGARCTGGVDHVASFGFDGTCRLTDGTVHHIHAHWQLLAQGTLRGTVSMT